MSIPRMSTPVGFPEYEEPPVGNVPSNDYGDMDTVALRRLSIDRQRSRAISAINDVDLRHPVPDFHALQRVRSDSVEQLERSAERLSMGSNVGEEIQKLKLEQKRSESRRSSIKSPVAWEMRAGDAKTRSRNASASSYTHSIVDVNGAARWGGYSPNGYVVSPVGSLRSAISHASRARTNSGKQPLRVRNFSEPKQEGKPLDSPMVDHESEVPVSPADYSFGQQPDAIAEDHERDQDAEIATMLRIVERISSAPDPAMQNDLSPVDVPDRPPTAASTDTYHQAGVLFNDFDGVHYLSNAETIPEQDRGLSEEEAERRDTFPDRIAHRRRSHAVPPPLEGMVYYPAPVPKMLNLPKRLSRMPAPNVQAQRRTQVLDSLPPEARQSATWLPQVLGPESHHQRSSSSEALRSSKDAKSRPSEDGEMDGKANPQRSEPNLTGLPPQLRASAFFEHQSIPQDITVRGESAVDTLDSLLNASARAPVHAFTDTLAGHVGREVYGKEVRSTSGHKSNKSSSGNNSRNTSSGVAPIMTSPEKRKNRLSSLNRLMGQGSAVDQLKTLQGTNGHELGVEEEDNEAGPGMTKHQRRLSSHGLENESELEEKQGFLEAHERIGPDDADKFDEGEEVYVDREPTLEELQAAGPPTTLLAELQLRKAQLRGRNRNAATAFAGGMHSTLLEMDAVAQIENKRRKGQRVTLAWEDPRTQANDARDDDDVPLAILFPGRHVLANRRNANGLERPIGLMERKELEDNEPLSSRRARLRGELPVRREQSPSKTLLLPAIELPHLSGQPDADEEPEYESETLAQRTRRLKTQEAGKATLGDSTTTGDVALLATSLVHQLGLGDGNRPTTKDGESPKDGGRSRKPSPAPAHTPSPDPDTETLGQRRRRLQAEAAARIASNGSSNVTTPASEQPATRPTVQVTHSMANLLSANPVGVRRTPLVSPGREGGLLHASQQTQERHRQEIQRQNTAGNTVGLSSPLVNTPPASTPRAETKKGSEGNMGGMFNRTAGGVISPNAQPQLNSSSRPTSQLQPSHAQSNSYFPAMPALPAAPHHRHNNSMPVLPTQSFSTFPNQHAQHDHGASARPQPGYPGRMSMPYPYARHMTMDHPSTQMQMPPFAHHAQPMDQSQRDLVDRWRQSVAH